MNLFTKRRKQHKWEKKKIDLENTKKVLNRKNIYQTSNKIDMRKEKKSIWKTQKKSSKG